MHFLAGFFYIVYRNEGTVFSMLCTLIANFGLSQLFNNNISMLRLLFYQTSRLIGIYLPHLHTHINQEGIKVSYFCAPWFLTAFSFTLQSCTTKCVPLLLNEIFDGFLTVLRSNK
eukprot:TRINITY_DN987_c0_g2_i1.p2 TRINITY_DN987_c0_g2~~TRINITY_DN987_c0_g2_i1.p2  ORF type:complete len:115 (-),score=19.90 TRINITY_DN987_c0_g2_i1:463-807(-)